ncbi:MAG: hypothetical protein HC938_04000 [Nitrospira sp.]|nr:hypothetical protein [Nitrospira sp.]
MPLKFARVLKRLNPDSCSFSTSSFTAAAMVECERLSTMSASYITLAEYPAVVRFTSTARLK